MNNGRWTMNHLIIESFIEDFWSKRARAWAVGRKSLVADWASGNGFGVWRCGDRGYTAPGLLGDVP